MDDAGKHLVRYRTFETFFEVEVCESDKRCEQVDGRPISDSSDADSLFMEEPDVAFIGFDDPEIETVKCCPVDQVQA